MGHYHSSGRMGQFILKRILRLLLTVIGETGEELTMNIFKTLSELQLPTQSMNEEGMKSLCPHLQHIHKEVFKQWSA